MNAIFSIRKQYSDLIFDGTKTWEFRTKRTKLSHGDKVYIYETKNGGCGMVVGYFIVDFIEEIKHEKYGCYNYLLEYAKKYCDEEAIKQVEKAMKINLTNYSNCLALFYLYIDDDLDYMLENHKPRENSIHKFLHCDMNEYEKNKEKQRRLIDGCDDWLSSIGFYNECDESTWKYRIRIKEAKRFERPIPIEEFCLLDGTPVRKAPQSFCYCSSNRE